MLTIFMYGLSIAALIYAERLRSIQKQARSTVKLYELQGSLMEFLRHEGTTISNADYRKARKMLEINERLLFVYSCHRPSLFHIKTLFSFINKRAKPVYDMDKKAKALRPKNEHLRELQLALASRIRWSVFYNTPIYIFGLMAISIFPIMVSLSTMKSTQAFYDWYKKAIEDEFKWWLEAKYHQLHIH